MKAKVFFYRFFILIFLFPGYLFGQLSSNRTIINGKIDGLKDGLRVYLLKNLVTREIDTIAITNVQKGEFHFNIEIPHGGGAFYFLSFDPVFSQKTKALFLDHSILQIRGTITEWPGEIMTSGSKANNDYELFQMTDRKYKVEEQNTLQEVGRLIQIKNAALERNEDTSKPGHDLLLAEVKLNEVRNTRYSFWQTFINDNPSSLYTPLLINRFSSVMGLSKVKIAYDKLSEISKKSLQGQQLKETILQMEFNRAIQIGNICPDFVSKTVDGKELSLKEVVSKSKYTIIDFWASWCIPCREEFKNVKQLYERYHVKGLNIIGISNDTKPEHWKDAIIKDQLPWYNVSDLEGNDGTLAKSFGIVKLPTNFILDSTGKIIAIDVFEKELEKLLKELFVTGK